MATVLSLALLYSRADKSCWSLFMIWSLFGHDIFTKASRVKTLFSQLFRIWSSAVSYFRAHCEGKDKNINPLLESTQSLHFSTWPKLEGIFSQI